MARLILLLTVFSFIFGLVPGEKVFYYSDSGDLMRLEYVSLLPVGCYYNVYLGSDLYEGMVLTHGHTFMETAYVPALYCGGGVITATSYTKSVPHLSFLPVVKR